MPHSANPSQDNVRKGAKRVSFCHEQVAKTARGLCEASYDELMSQDILYSTWKKTHPGAGPKALRKLFVEKNWSKYIEAARTTMALLLRSPIDDKTKEEIVDVLAKDATLIQSRLNPAVLAGTVQPSK